MFGNRSSRTNFGADENGEIIFELCSGDGVHNALPGGILTVDYIHISFLYIYILTITDYSINQNSANLTHQ